MYCMHCGEMISDNSRFCKYCGKLVAEDEINTVNTEEISENSNETEEVATESTNEISSSEAETDEYGSIIERAVEITEKEPDVEVIDDYFFEHISAGKKAGLFIGAVVLTAVIACVIFALFFS